MSECGWAETAIPTVKTLIDSLSWIAVEDGEGDQVVGFLRVLTDNDVVTYVTEIAVDERFRSRGIGRMLMHRVQAQFSTTRIDVLSSESAERFYDALGYSERPAFRRYQ